jgi:hypothetical protein
MAARDSSAAILWHKYRNDEYPRTHEVPDELARQRSIFYIEETALCAWFNHHDESIVRRLSI